MTTRAQLVTEARSYIGVKYQHQGRSKETGVDCIGIVIGIAHTFGLSSYDITDYAMAPNVEMMAAELRANLDEIGFKQLLLGDIIWFRVIHDPQHIGIVTQLEPELLMVHSYARDPVMAVVEQPLGRLWRDRVAGCFRYRGIED